MSQDRSWRAISTIAGVLWGIGVFALLLLGFATLDLSNEKGRYCESIDHQDPCTRLQATSSEEVLLAIAGAFVMVLMGVFVLALSRSPMARREFRGLLLTATSLLWLGGAFAVLLGLHF
ncbi:hypothetical protein [Actinomadura sp. SCN-SB]|uniref:hypothetical protein n=1 Tax=Actinomadura sp. SCN-SB TaxID=3373092 RepID=UPI0037533A12